MLSLTSAVLVGLLCTLLWQLWRRKVASFQNLQEQGVPCLAVQPLFGGNMKQLMKLRGLETHRKLLKELGPVSGFYFGSLKAVQLADYDLIRQICIRRAGEFPNRCSWFRKLAPEPNGFL